MGSAPEDQRLGVGLIQVVRLLPAVSLAGTVGLGALMALAAVLPVGFVLASGRLVGQAPAVVDAGLGSPEGAALLRTLAVVAAFYLGHQVVDQMSFVHGQNLGRRLDSLLRERTVEACMGPPGIAHLEDERNLDAVSLARNPSPGMFVPGGVVLGLGVMLPPRLAVLGSALVVATFSPWLAALLLLGCAISFAGLVPLLLRPGQGGPGRPRRPAAGAVFPGSRRHPAGGQRGPGVRAGGVARWPLRRRLAGGGGSLVGPASGESGGRDGGHRGRRGDHGGWPRRGRIGGRRRFAVVGAGGGPGGRRPPDAHPVPRQRRPGRGLRGGDRAGAPLPPRSAGRISAPAPGSGRPDGGRQGPAAASGRRAPGPRRALRRRGVRLSGNVAAGARRVRPGDPRRPAPGRGGVQRCRQDDADQAADRAVHPDRRADNDRRDRPRRHRPGRLAALRLGPLPGLRPLRADRRRQRALRRRPRCRPRRRGRPGAGGPASRRRGGTRPPPAGELRIFGLESTIAERHRDLRRTVDRQIASGRTAAAVREAAGLVVFGAGYVLAIGLAVREAAAGRATAGDLVLALTAAAGVRDQVGGLAWTVGSLAAGKKAVARYLWLVDHAEAVRRDAQAAGSGSPVPAPDRLREGIRLSGVGFRYGAEQEDALRDVDLHLPAGSVVAVVGENGAGKSTLVKLLARLYEPTSGHLEVDGVPLRRIDPASWRARISAGFEDFVCFELLLREAVGIGNLPALDDDRAVTRALHHAGAHDIPEQLPGGLVTRLGTSWEGAVDLSRGQWQKLALARGMMREEPLLLLLDESTAALDAETEHALFERYAAAARAAGGRSGAITILVSHRFSTVRMADLIVVVDGGRIVEGGTHAHLIAQGGLYAELYEVQAEGYR